MIFQTSILSTKGKNVLTKMNTIDVVLGMTAATEPRKYASSQFATIHHQNALMNILLVVLIVAAAQQKLYYA